LSDHKKKLVKQTTAVLKKLQNGIISDEDAEEIKNMVRDSSEN